MTRYILVTSLLMFMAACGHEPKGGSGPAPGQWRGVITMQGQEVPFNFEVKGDDRQGYHVFLLNAGERLLLDEVTVNGDSIDIALHIFDANIKAKITGNSLNGTFIKNTAEDYRLPFRAVHGHEYRFELTQSEDSTADFSGKYEVIFLHEGDTTKAIALFEQSGNRVTGTFMTPTGDYRFLEGSASGKQLALSTFDGNHLYLFRASMETEGYLTGDFYSGKTWHEKWVATKNENATLPDAASLTYLREGYDRISFTFPDVTGKKVSLEDKKYRNKVVVLQLLGTWCPNCMDETRFLAPWYEANKARGIEVIGLAYESKDDFGYASGRVKKMVAKMDIGYDVLIAGTDDKESAAKTLPMLNAIVAFPTTIFIGRNGQVKKIHTGFNGPGTGKYYDQFKEEFNETVNDLLKEDITSHIQNK